MAFEPGQSGNPGGKKPGTLNVFTRTVKEVVLETFNKLQEDPATNLESFARKFPKDFHAIAAKLIPAAIHAEISAPAGIQIIYKSADECKPIGFDPDSGKDS